MTEGAGQITVRTILEGAPDHRRALHAVLGLTMPAARSGNARPVEELLNSAAKGLVSLDLLLGAYRGGKLIACCLVMEAPGRAAMAMISQDAASSEGYDGLVEVLQAAQAAAWRRSVVLLEVLAPVGRRALGGALRASGFRFLTNLQYMRRDVRPDEASIDIGCDVNWVSYEATHASLFARAMELTYVQSQDCTELTGLRSSVEVLEGHQATGAFDPALWWVATRADEPVGVMLLNRISSELAFEVVYMGVAQPVRGTGVANALLSRAVRRAASRGANCLALAVDERNEPARRMYARWGFVQTGARAAWIATSVGARG